MLLLTVNLHGQCRDVLFATDAKGATVAGSKDELRRHVHSGSPVRVAWAIDGDADGRVDVTHWADAMFLTEFENEIFTQISEIRRQSPKRGTAAITFGAEPQRWTGMLGTNGMVEGAFDTAGEPHRLRVATWWCRIPPAANCTSQWRLAYHHDIDGRVVAGRKEALVDAVRRGYPIRLTWGMSVPSKNISVEHVAEPVFATITNGREVVAQLPEHIGQQSYWDVQQAGFEDPAVLWRGIMTTTGSFDAVWVNRGTGKVVRRLPQKARIAWHVFSPDSSCTREPAPVLAVEGGVIVRK